MCLRGIRWLAIAAGLALKAPTAQAASGFVREPGAGYAKLFFSSFSSKDYYALNGDLRNGGQRLTQRGVSLYGEYGLIRHLAIAINVPGFRSNSYSESDTARGFGDVFVELKGGETFAGWHTAIAVAGEIPTGRSRAFVDNGAGGVINLPTGDGEANIWVRAAVSRSIDALHAYASADVGYNVRTKGFTDQVGFSCEVGHHLLDRIWLAARLRGLFTRGSASPNVPFLYGEGTEYLAIDGGIAVPVLDALQLTFDYTNIAAARRNVYGGSLFSAGVAAQW